jgi:uncharacterized Zn finger protein
VDTPIVRESPPKVTPNSRAERALELYRTHGRDIELLAPDVYLVPSCAGEGQLRYRVHYGEESCTCPDHAHHPERACKHILAVGILNAKRRGATVRALAALEESYRHQLVPDEERQELRDRVLRLRRRLGL